MVSPGFSSRSFCFLAGVPFVRGSCTKISRIPVCSAFACRTTKKTRVLELLEAFRQFTTIVFPVAACLETTLDSQFKEGKTASRLEQKLPSNARQRGATLVLLLKNEDIHTLGNVPPTNTRIKPYIILSGPDPNMNFQNVATWECSWLPLPSSSPWQPNMPATQDRHIGNCCCPHPGHLTPLASE